MSLKRGSNNPKGIAWTSDRNPDRIVKIKVARALMFHLKKLGIRVEAEDYGLLRTKEFVLRRFPFVRKDAE